MATQDEIAQPALTGTSGAGLARTLRKHHITGIGISGTIGAGLFITSGEIIGLAGSLGAVISYLIAGLMVVCVMLCISEMISVRPVAGAFFEFPEIYVDPALGFATGWAYWLAWTCACCTLIVQAAMILNYWSHISVPVGILICWVPINFFNLFFPVLWYGNLEWAVKWLKLFLIAVLLVLMISIAAGVHGNGDLSTEPPSTTWNASNLFPPGLCFAEWSKCMSQGPDIHGNVGRFLGIWTGTTLAVFAFLGVEIVMITAGEAEYPRYDLPIATRWIYLFAVFVYFILVLMASLNVPYYDPALLPYGAGNVINATQATLKLFPKANDGSITTGDRSPFVIAVKRAGFTSALPGFLNGCLFFASLTAANTAFYVSSRTLYAISNTSSNERLRNTLGKTSYGHYPLWAILVTTCFSLCSWIGSIKGKENELVGAVSRITVTSILCVYVAECISFIRYQNFVKRHTKKDRDYKNTDGQHNWYRSPGHQPLPAYVGAGFGILLIFFNGWDTFYRAHHHQLSSADIAAGILRSYLGPVLFVIMFFTYKMVKDTTLVSYQEYIKNYNPGDKDIDKLFNKKPSIYLQRWRRVLAEVR